MANATGTSHSRTSHSRTVSAGSSRSVSRAPTSKEPSVAASELPVHITDDDEVQNYASELVGVLVETPEDFDRGEYMVLEGEHVVHEVLREYDDEDGIILYNIRFEDNHTEMVSPSPVTCRTHIYSPLPLAPCGFNDLYICSRLVTQPALWLSPLQTFFISNDKISFTSKTRC
jgi:hypothetical protein